jgi:hypothetical protein
MFFCKRCGGTLYEETVFWDENKHKFMQIGCYLCSDKVYAPFKEWVAFKNKVAKALGFSCAK